MPSTNSPVEVSKEAYEYLTRGDWYSWGETDVLNADGVFVSKPRDRIVFGKYYMEEYRVDLDTGEYELLTRQNYRAKIKGGQCVVTFPDNKDFYYVGSDDLLHYYFKSKVDGEWMNSGTDSLWLNGEK